MGKTAILIMAAGAATRMKTPKQLLPWGTKTLVENAITEAQNSLADSVHLVLGANAVLIKKQIFENDLNFLENPHWNLGLGDSIAFGVREVLKKEVDLTSILIMLADQPLINSDYLNKLIKASGHYEKGIIASLYGEKKGVPALFSKDYFPALSQLTGEHGAKYILNNNTKDICSIECKNLITDIDTPEDYQHLYLAHFGTNNSNS